MAASKLMSIAIIVISLAVGFIFYYILSDLSKEQKKRHMEEMFSQLINFIVFMWIGKIILNFNVFINDPIAILAYPSNSEAFYLAVLFSAIMLNYKAKRKPMDMLVFIRSFLLVFLVASFMYEFIQLVWNNNTYSFGYLFLLIIMLVVFFLSGRITTTMLIVTMLIGWCVGMVLLSFVYPFATVFGYIIAPWFVGVFFITSICLITFNTRKRVS
ncbi:hypothetical protein [Virgibacillus sp. DJP39]|uniref:hypothetical protein n=1 Tax=Virgibacillus sp. DJP39 TaxID=3409790 RepID=UPI003BB72B5A